MGRLGKMGFVFNMITFTFFFALVLSLLGGSSSPMNQILTGQTTILTQVNGFFNNPLQIAGLAAAVVIGSTFFPNPWAIFLVATGFIFSYFTFPSGLFNSASLGISDPAVTLFFQGLQSLIQVTFSIALLSWFKGGPDI